MTKCLLNIPSDLRFSNVFSKYFDLAYKNNYENIRLLKLLYTLKAVITFLQLSDLSLSNHIFWRDYLMFNIDPE